MKKITMVLLIALVLSVGSFGQDGGSGVVITSGDNLLSVGFNLDDLFNGGGPGFSVAWDHGVSFAQSFSFGAQAFVGFYDGGIAISPDFRAAWHPFAMPALAGKVAIAPKFDPYVMYAVGTEIFIGDNGSVWGFDWRGAIGLNWMFAGKMGLWAEFGNYVVVGLTWKL